MRIRTAFLLVLAMYFVGDIGSGLYRWHLRQQLNTDPAVAAYADPHCDMGESPMSVDGRPPECMSGDQYQAEELAERAIREGDAPDLLGILQQACGSGAGVTCFEAAYLAERMR